MDALQFSNTIFETQRYLSAVLPEYYKKDKEESFEDYLLRLLGVQQWYKDMILSVSSPSLMFDVYHVNRNKTVTMTKMVLQWLQYNNAFEASLKFARDIVLNLLKNDGVYIYLLDYDIEGNNCSITKCTIEPHIDYYVILQKEVLYGSTPYRLSYISKDSSFTYNTLEEAVIAAQQNLTRLEYNKQAHIANISVQRHNLNGLIS